MRQRWIVPVLMAFAVVGGILVVTADETDDVALDSIVTDEGVVTRIPAGWVVSEQFPFDFRPPGDGPVFDQWTVARACPIEGCGARSLDEWSALAAGLPTFTSIVEAEGEDTFNLRAEVLPDARVLRAQTEAASILVFVAAFTDGAEEYVACSVRLSLTADERLADEIVDVCRASRLDPA